MASSAPAVVYDRTQLLPRIRGWLAVHNIAATLQWLRHAAIGPIVGKHDVIHET